MRGTLVSGIASIDTCCDFYKSYLYVYFFSFFFFLIFFKPKTEEEHKGTKIQKYKKHGQNIKNEKYLRSAL